MSAAARTICRTWAKRYGRVPDFVVLEGCQAGGHLGFEEADLLAGRCAPLSQLIPQVLAALRPFEEKFGRAIPLFCAGGVATGAEMARCTRLGAAGAQMATRFIAAEECDASQGYKDVILAARPDDGGLKTERFRDALAARERARAGLATLDESQKRMLNPHSYPVGLEHGLFEHRSDLVAKLRGFE